MTDTQLYLAIGIPTIALVLGMIGNGFLFNALSARMSSLDSGLSERMSSLDNGLSGRMSGLENRMLALETSMNARFDLIMGRLSDLDTRLSVLEDRSKRP
ncbi:MAG: hypothetical protein P4L56_13965 [Candidatus Sulfopaludibacter sp.]|nr:hypothetical protein [Candidatus Sulfopaludibacter sp.]